MPLYGGERMNIREKMEEAQCYNTNELWDLFEKNKPKPLELIEEARKELIRRFGMKHCFCKELKERSELKPNECDWCIVNGVMGVKND